MKIKTISYIVLFAVIFFVIGEIDFRLISHEQRLEYVVDNELYHRVRPNQKGYEWMGQLSFKSPPMHINSLGLRNAELDLSDKSKYRILATGSSVAFGSGVEDSETWSYLLQQKLNDFYKTNKYEVLNGANPGWGPFQYSVFLKRFAPSIKPDLLIIISGPADVRFLPIKDKENEKKYLQNAKIRKKLLSISPFATYCLRKLDIYITRLLKSVTAKKEHDSPATIKAFWDMQKNYFQEMIETAKSNNIPLIIFVYYFDKPNEAMYIYKDLISLNNDTSHYYCWYLGSEFLEGKKYEEVIIPQDLHLNKEGNALLSKVIFEHLKNFFEKQH